MIHSKPLIKKNFFTLLLCLGVSFTFLAHSQAKIDTLKSQFRKAKSDTERVTIFNNIADEYSAIDSFPDAFRNVKEALQLARVTGSDNKIAESRLNASVVFWRSGQNDTAMYYIKQAIAYFEKGDPSKTLVRAYKIEGGIYKDMVQFKEANEIYTKGLNMAQKLKDSTNIYSLNNALGNVCEVNGDFDLALTYYQNAIDMALALKQYRSAIGSCNLLGNIYAKQGISASAAKAYFQALEINAKYLKQDEINGVIDVNLGNVYNDKNDSANAMKYYRESLAIFSSLNKKEYMAQLLGNMGNVYMNSGDYKKAEGYELQAMKEVETLGDRANTAVCYTNVAEFYNHTKQFDKAAEYYNKALQLQQEMGDKEGEEYTYSGLGQLCENTGDYAKALGYGVKAFDLAKEIPLERQVRDEAKILSELYGKMHQADKALDFYKIYIDARDTLENKEEAKKLIRAELDHEYEQKQQVEKLENEKQQAIAEEKQRRERGIRNIFLAAFIVVLFLTGLLLRNLLRIRKSKQIITEQKIEVEFQKSVVDQKNKDITDSINYARRIQHAMLPTAEEWGQLFAGSFIYYRPKDIVSGDFYWCIEFGNEVIFTAADCTGHGVPGAFMSMLGISSLNKIVGEKGIKAPDAVLNELREEIIHSLNPGGKKEVKDGMDMTLCRLDREKMKLEYAAANNPLWIVTKRDGKCELKDCDADKIPVGKYVNEQTKFTLRTEDIKKGDRIYIFTDGYADQFGGIKGKKFKYQHLQDVVLACQDKSMKDQCEVLGNTMNEWKGNLEQVDDILIIGIEV